MDILASHALSDLRKYMVSENDEKKRLKEAIARCRRQSVVHDPFVHVSDERVRTVLDGHRRSHWT